MSTCSRIGCCMTITAIACFALTTAAADEDSPNLAYQMPFKQEKSLQ